MLSRVPVASRQDREYSNAELAEVGDIDDAVNCQHSSCPKGEEVPISGMKSGVDVLGEFAEAWRELEAKNTLSLAPGGVHVTPNGLLQIDRCLLAFFEPEF